MASMMPFLGAAAGSAMQAYDQSNYRNKMMDLQEKRLDQSGKLDERRMDLTEQQISAHKDLAEKQELKDVLGTFMTMNEMTSDADRPKLVDQWNSVIVPRFSKYGIPTISSLNRKGKYQYNLKTGPNGEEYAIGLSDQGDLVVKPVMTPSGVQLKSEAKPIEVGDDRALIRPGDTEPYFKGPKYGVDKVGSDKIGSTKESLIAKKSRGEEWNEHEQAAWDLMDEREKQIANETMRILAGSPDFMEMKPQEQESAAKKVLGTFKSVFGRKKEGGAQDQQAAPPVEKLKEGVRTKFKNGETWTLQGGKPMRVE